MHCLCILLMSRHWAFRFWFESFLIFILWSDSSFSAQQLPPPSRQQNSNWPSLVAGSSSCGPSPTNRQSPSTNPTSQLTLHPIRAGYSASRFPPNVSARSPIINTISLPVGNLQPGGEIRAPAPHLQPFRPWWHNSFFLLPCFGDSYFIYASANIVVLILMPIVFFHPF